MRTILIAIGAFLFIAAQVCGWGSFEAKAQTSVMAVTKEEPKTIRLKITGMTCAGCANHVAKTMKELNGVLEQKVEYPGDVATVKYNPAKTSVDAIIRAIENIGYKAAIVAEKTVAKQS